MPEPCNGHASNGCPMQREPTPMKFGIFGHLEMRRGVPLAELYEERLKLVEQADRAGIYCWLTAEHHHSPLCMAPNQMVFLAAAAARTSRIKLGSLVSVLP